MSVQFARRTQHRKTSAVNRGFGLSWQMGEKWLYQTGWIVIVQVWRTRFYIITSWGEEPAWRAVDREQRAASLKSSGSGSGS